MATPDKDSSQTGPAEEPTTHSKKAQIVTILLVLIVVAGLVIQTWMNINKRAAREEAKSAEEIKRENALGTPRPAAKIADFAKSQEQAAGELAAADKDKKDKAARKEVLDEAEESTSTDAGNPMQKKSPEAVERDFSLTERTRVLEAMRGKMGIASRNKDKNTSEAPSQGNQGEIAKVNERIASLTAGNTGIEQRQRDLIERAKAAGVQLPPELLSRVGAGAQGAPAIASPATSPLQPAASSNKAFGELATNRVARDPSNAGPQPGEKILPTGSIISAVTDMEMISDYAGNWWALIQRPVYDSEQDTILLPAGTKVVGKSVRATGVNESIQNRMGAMPLWVIRPDGKRIDFKHSAGMDAAGVSALKDQVDRHFLAQFFGVGAYALIGLGPSMSNYGAEPNTSRDAFVREATAKTRDIGRSFAEKYLNIVPTQKIRAGTPMKIFIEDDIYITPWTSTDEANYSNR
jgi:type IV secretory pathway VirB10-like protein